MPHYRSPALPAVAILRAAQRLATQDDGSVAQDPAPTPSPTPTLPVPKGAPWSASEQAFLGAYAQYADLMETGMNDISTLFFESMATPGLAASPEWQDKLVAASLVMRSGGEGMLTLRPSGRLRKFHNLVVGSARSAIQSALACPDAVKQMNSASLYVCTQNMVESYETLEKAKLELAKLLRAAK